ncbi:MAG: PAS domain S-box protein [Ignavibacteriaceae bacterium]|nr:PAS domain S-box protein [Ignavibacteriaceae bacterium]
MNNKYSFGFELFESFHDMCFILSSTGEILKINNSAHDALLSNGTIIIGTNFIDLMETTFKEKFRLIFTNCVMNSKSESVYSVIALDKELIDVSILIIPSKNKEKEQPEIYFIIAKNITEQRKKELDLLRFYYVAENTVNPLQITDITGKMVYANPAFTQVSGYSKEELIGQNPSIFGSGKHSRKFWTRVWNTINSGKVWVGEVENRKKGGEPFFTQLLISPILDQDGNVSAFFGIHRDLSEKRIMERQLIHTQKMESIGTLAAGVAHEVGNPLASISALVQVVQRSTDDPFVKEKLELVKNQVTRISKIIRDLVDFSRPSNYELQLTDINHNVAEAVEIIKVGTKAKNINFKVFLSDKIPLLPLVADQIQQVFVNILLNAVDAISEHNPPKRDCNVEVKTDANEDNVIITFEDDGVGIQEENLVKIFEPFYTTKKEGKGTGLGLWVSYGIIKSFQGDILVESTIDEGTIFKILLPIHP